ncbi:hypothetical protein EOM09_06060 [bacterium]|nr:hypothetical protein [bacterium]
MTSFSAIIGSIIGFIFIMGLFFTTYFTYTENILSQQKLLQEQNTNFLKIQEKFEIYNPFYSQGRFGIFLKNTGNTKINLKDSNFKECFSVYFNDEFISKDTYNIYLLKNLAYKYNILDLEEEAIISFNTNYNLSINNTIKIISCLGNSLEYTIEKEKISWWNENYRERKTFSIENPSNKSLFEYQILLDLNSSNFDFENIKEKEFRFVFNYDYGLELSLNFDEYENTLKENSNNININANLGDSNLNEINNPLEEKNGIFKNGLEFNLDELNPQPYWGFNDLEHKIGSKLHNCFFVQAEVKKINGLEHYWYKKVQMLETFSFEGFLNELEKGNVLVDFDARTGHNHGTKFRLRQNFYPNLYKKSKLIIDL